MHIHAAVGLKALLPPGIGEIDFDAITACLPANIPVVLELKPGTGDDAIQTALAFMKTCLDS